MEKLAQLFQDVVQLWDKYHVMYLNGIKNTLILALVATVIGCLIGLVCGVLNTIPYTKNDPWPKRFLLKLLRVLIRIYVEVFRGTPMVLQAVFVYYGLPYFTDNAVKFTEEGGTITVYMAEVNGRLQFNIINTGSQIPQDKIKFVFDRFYKGDTSRNRNSSGSGLGLYITKTVVKQHGGDIFVRSNDNKTEFCFTIPLNC